MTQTENQTITPPYISISKMQKVFDLLSNRSFPSLSPDDLTNRGFSKAEAFQALHALRFLGLMDQEGNLKDLKFLALKGDARVEGLRGALTSSYHKLFERTENPASLPKDELYNEFIAEYDLSPRLTRAALPLFFWLSKEAGYVVSQEIEPRQRSSSTKTKSPQLHGRNSKIPPQPDHSIQGDEYHTYNISKVILKVPKNEKTDILIAKGGLIGITEKIEEFVSKAELAEINNDITTTQGS